MRSPQLGGRRVSGLGVDHHPQPTARATVITDASFCPHTKASGWAAWITVNPVAAPVQRIKRSGHFKDQPDQPYKAELWATYNGIWLAYQAGARDILVQTDCLNVVQKGVNGEGYAAASLHWPDAFVRWKHVKGHTDTNDARSFVNRWCDTEAKVIMKKERKDRGWRNSMRKRKPSHRPQ